MEAVGHSENYMALTPYHAKYFAYELTGRYSSVSLQKLAASLSDAQVDLNPHQVEAALFAFRSPLSKGAILADEVGLGKTIEAGIVISQKYAERKAKDVYIKQIDWDLIVIDEAHHLRNVYKNNLNRLPLNSRLKFCKSTLNAMEAFLIQRWISSINGLMT